nr:hypothetical protein [Candidatus Gracilibacteria bacterium]
MLDSLSDGEIESEQTKLDTGDVSLSCKKLLGAIYQSVPSFPESWDETWKKSYYSLICLIEKNPEWWSKCKDKIELTDEGIYFKELGFTILRVKGNYINELEMEGDIKLINELSPKVDECELIKKFLDSVFKDYDEINKQKNSKSNFHLLKTFIGIDSNCNVIMHRLDFEYIEKYNWIFNFDDGIITSVNLRFQFSKLYIKRN